MSRHIFDFPGRLVHGCVKASARDRTQGITRAKRNGNTPKETLMSIFDLSGRVAIITGGNGGIGLGIAHALNAAGANGSTGGRNAAENQKARATTAAAP